MNLRKSIIQKRGNFQNHTAYQYQYDLIIKIAEKYFEPFLFVKAVIASVCFFFLIQKQGSSQTGNCCENFPLRSMGTVSWERTPLFSVCILIQSE